MFLKIDLFAHGSPNGRFLSTKLSQNGGQKQQKNNENLTVKIYAKFIRKITKKGTKVEPKWEPKCMKKVIKKTTRF